MGPPGEHEPADLPEPQQAAGGSVAAASVHWRIGVTLLVLGIPVLYAVAFQLAGLPFSVGMFGYGALGWYIALLARVPVGLLLKRLRVGDRRASTLLMPAMSGPAEEVARCVLVYVVPGATTFRRAASIGIGWSAVEIVFSIVQGVVAQRLLSRTDAKGDEARARLTDVMGDEAMRNALDPSPAAMCLGALERVSATSFHIAMTLLIARSPYFAILTIPLHSATNLTMMAMVKRCTMATAEAVFFVYTTAVLTAAILIQAMPG
ncbi:YhfC family intramembrane metalloprotease [Plasmodiophora brassicae]